MLSDVYWALGWCGRIMLFVLPTTVAALLGFAGLVVARMFTPIPAWLLKLLFVLGFLPFCGLLLCFYLLYRASPGGWVINDTTAVLFILLAFGTGLTGFFAFSSPFRYASLGILVPGLVMLLTHPPFQL